jgi:hypothetical protein
VRSSLRGHRVFAIVRELIPPVNNAHVGFGTGFCIVGEGFQASGTL